MTEKREQPWAKTCTSCGATGPALTLFGVNTSAKDGRNARCKLCIRVASRKQESTRKEYTKAYREQNRERLRELAAQKYKRSPEVLAKREAAKKKAAEKLEQKRAERAERAEFDKVWAQLGKLRGAVRSQLRKDEQWWKTRDKRLEARKPAWVNWDDFKDVYTRARDLTMSTGVPHAVDHIYPLKSGWVCGLHTPANLHVLTQKLNGKKRNRPWGPCGDELPDKLDAEVCWPGESVTYVQKREAFKLLPLVGRFPVIAPALIEFLVATGEPEGLRITQLRASVGAVEVGDFSPTKFVDLRKPNEYRSRKRSPTVTD